MEKFIEIPFGAKDSELGGWEYTIPKGYTASIENGKIIVKKEESDDEKMKKEITELVMQPTWKTEKEFKRRKVLCAWLEKQCEQKPTDEEMKILLQTEYEKGKADAIEQKSDWSEDDEKAVNDIMWIIEAYRKNRFNETHIQIANDSENWLKSLKERYTWKPSDEQMVVLELASKYERVFTSKQIDVLISLKEQLKKLREK